MCLRTRKHARCCLPPGKQMADTKVISFRVETELYQTLYLQSVAENKSVSESARDLLLKALQAERSSSKQADSTDLTSEISALRQQIANSLEAILIATRALSPQDARLLTAKQFRMEQL